MHAEVDAEKAEDSTSQNGSASAGKNDAPSSCGVNGDSVAASGETNGKAEEKNEEVLVSYFPGILEFFSL